MSTPQAPYGSADDPSSAGRQAGSAPGTPYPAGTEPLPAVGAPSAPTKNAFGVWSLVLGVLSVVLCCLALGVPLGAAAIVLGVMARRATAAGTATNGGTGLAGIVLGAVGAAASVGLVVLFLVGVAQYGGWDAYMDEVRSAVEQQQLQQP